MAHQVFPNCLHMGPDWVWAACGFGYRQGLDDWYNPTTTTPELPGADRHAASGLKDGTI